ncbi:hypothetical protein HII36_01680 [Nonomuraea sp. NN258]|uniref:hypothetical protein n=1 Tax=Nonomuraea antri TaxID=2730852 RepID=UPI001568784B|nr:hypothetical protein [Nonomuraea antri]NRQ30557.1 hypothetical protein [Nonomuraea antri]
MSSLTIELDPLRGAGPVLLGATRERAGAALRAWGEPREHAPYPGALPLDWRLTGGGVDVHVHCGSTGVVQTIEIFRDDDDTHPAARVLLLGMDVFATPAEDVLATLGERFEVEIEDGFGGTVPELSVGLGGMVVPDDEDRARFGHVLIAGPGYYDRPTR